MLEIITALLVIVVVSVYLKYVKKAKPNKSSILKFLKAEDDHKYSLYQIDHCRINIRTSIRRDSIIAIFVKDCYRIFGVLLQSSAWSVGFLCIGIAEINLAQIANLSLHHVQINNSIINGLPVTWP